MKRILLCLAAGTLMLFSCKKTESADLITDTPKTEIPPPLRGQWLNGNFSMGQWWTYDGQYAGNPYESSRAFTFNTNGEAEFFQVIRTNDSYCTTEAFTYFKGSTAFDSDAGKLVFYPRQGNFRGFYSCTSDRNFNRSAAKEELKPITLYYEAITDTQGQRWMVTSFTANAPDSEKTYFKLTSW